jgi:hypothetical protein
VNPWKIVVATLVIFGTGVITGGLLVSYSDRALHRSVPGPRAANNPRPMPGTQNPMARENRVPPPMPAPLRKDFLDRLERELNLTTGQRDRIEKIIAEGQDRTRQVWQTVEPEMRTELMTTRERIRNELNADQLQRFEDIMRHPQRRPDDVSTNRPYLRRGGSPPRGVTSDPSPPR